MAVLSEIRHATAVSWKDYGVLIEGRSGSGKSTLALALMAFGAELIADDRTFVVCDGEGQLWLDAPESLPAMIEARGIGLLPARLAGPTCLRLVVGLGAVEPARLPPDRSRDILNRRVALLCGTGDAQFAAALIQFMKGQVGF